MKRSEEEIKALAEELWDLMDRAGKARISKAAKAALLKEVRDLEAEAGTDFESIKFAALELRFERYSELKTW
ncbi:MAG: hypothetical protein IKF70_02620 [Firmicutes bacterium]|nr:hypothetical protein [Bacillota bacterium]